MKTGRDSNIFHSFPSSFFNALTGMNRELIETALTALYERTSYGTSYTLTFEDACLIIEDILAEHEYEMDEEEESLTNDHERALFVLRRLRSCGWISDEIGENYQRFVHFEDYAVELLHTIRRISSDESEEYSGYIFTIWQLLRSVDPVNGDLALERASSNTEDLFRQLVSLNTNIKKYIQRLLDDENRDDLHKLMEMLLDEYQSGIVDRAYYNLTTRDNPQKFREAILTAIIKLRNDESILDSLTRQSMERKGIGYEDAYERIHDQLDYIEQSFSSIDGLMKEIDHKNHKYVTSALARITFLLEAHEDLEGKINRILKALISGEMEPEGLFQLYRTAYLDSESLYTLKKKRVKVKQSFAEINEPDPSAINEFLEILANEQKFSRAGVENHIMNLLGEKSEVRAGDLSIIDFESFTYLVLGYLYGHDEDGKYTVDEGNETVRVNGYRFRDFTIRRTLNG